MNHAYDFVDLARMPQPDGSIAPDAFGLPGVTALTAQILPALVGTTGLWMAAVL